MSEPIITDGAAASIITDHPFEPRAEWWSLCKRCGLAKSAHVASVTDDASDLAERESVPKPPRQTTPPTSSWPF
jgi:hypothetical protein